jgi:sister-chromatid-cohesion protein PDS5
MMAEDIGIEPETAGEKGLRLLFVLAFGFPAHFMTEDVLSRLVNILSLDSQDHSVSAMVLCILTFVGKYRPLETQFQDIVSQLIPICERLATEGTTKQAKHAMRCLHVNITNQEQVFSKILESLKDNLVTSSPHCRTSIVTLGHMALLLPDRFTIQIKNIVSRKIVKELLLKVHQFEIKFIQDNEISIYQFLTCCRTMEKQSTCQLKTQMMNGVRKINFQKRHDAKWKP